MYVRCKSAILTLIDSARIKRIGGNGFRIFPEISRGNNRRRIDPHSQASTAHRLESLRGKKTLLLRCNVRLVQRDALDLGDRFAEDIPAAAGCTRANRAIAISRRHLNGNIWPRFRRLAVSRTADISLMRCVRR